MGATCHACIGGTNVRNEMQKLQAEAPHIVVGTPGRVFDMLNRRYLCKYCLNFKVFFNKWLWEHWNAVRLSLLTAPKWIKMFVLDEADEMLSRGFKDQIYEIFQKLNTSIQVRFIPYSFGFGFMQVQLQYNWSVLLSFPLLKVFDTLLSLPSSTMVRQRRLVSNIFFTC